MRLRTILLVLVLSTPLLAENLEKVQKKSLEGQVKAVTAEAQRLEKAGQLAEARRKYSESQALIEMKDVTEAIKHLDEEIKKRVKEKLSEARKLYEARKFKDAVAVLDEGMKLQAFQSLFAYNLALCHFQLGDRQKAMEYLGKAKAGTGDPKQKQKLAELATHFTTGENGLAVNESDKARIVRVNALSESIGVDAYLEDSAEDAESTADAAETVAPTTPQSALTREKASRSYGNSAASHRSSLCDALSELKETIGSSPAATFNLANCAETNGRTAEAARLLERYLELAPNALDGDQAHVRIAELKSLLTLQGKIGSEIRRLYASAYEALAERQYDRALTDLNRAGDLAPDFPLTQWTLGLLHEALGDTTQARGNFTRYIQLTPDQAARDEATLHLSTLDAKRSKYDEEADAAADIISDLFERAMNLAFEGSEKRSAMRVRRAHVKNKNDQARAQRTVGGFAIPFAYAQQQLAQASEHLQVALALFPLGAEANELMALVSLQANDGHFATRSFDVVSSQGLPVSFYAEMRGHKQDQAVKCELSRDSIRLINLSSYDKNGKSMLPDKPAGEDGLGDLVVKPQAPRQQAFDSLDLALGDIKRVETKNGMLRLKLADHDIALSPIYLPTFTPIEGPQARRFANNYTRLFVRYPGLEDSKLGAEGMSGGEKVRMAYNITSASMDIAMSGFSGIGAIASVQDAISITRTIRAAMISLNVGFATWEKSVEDQQQLLAGKSFKAIPTQPANMAFMQEIK